MPPGSKMELFTGEHVVIEKEGQLITTENSDPEFVRGLYDPATQARRTIDMPRLPEAGGSDDYAASNDWRSQELRPDRGASRRRSRTAAGRGSRAGRRERGGQVHADEGAQRRGATRRRDLDARRPAVLAARAREARRRGVVMVYQELAVCPDLTVEANVMLGQESHCPRLPRRPDEPARVRPRHFVNSGIPRSTPRIPCPLSAHPRTAGGRDRPRAAHRREGARARRTDERLDAARTCSRLFDLVRRLKARGVTVVYISHFLEEIEAVADRFTVLRDGVGGGAGKVGEVPREKIIEMMVGRAVEEQYPHTAARDRRAGAGTHRAVRRSCFPPA